MSKAKPSDIGEQRLLWLMAPDVARVARSSGLLAQAALARAPLFLFGGQRRQSLFSVDDITEPSGCELYLLHGWSTSGSAGSNRTRIASLPLGPWGAAGLFAPPVLMSSAKRAMNSRTVLRICG